MLVITNPQCMYKNVAILKKKTGIFTQTYVAKIPLYVQNYNKPSDRRTTERLPCCKFPL